MSSQNEGRSNIGVEKEQANANFHEEKIQTDGILDKYFKWTNQAEIKHQSMFFKPQLTSIKDSILNTIASPI